MKVVHWNISKREMSMTALKKYEDNLYRSMLKYRDRYDLELVRIQRKKGSILGSTVASWLFTYKTNGADVVHATFQTLAPAGMLKRPKKFVLTVHDLALERYPEEIKNLSVRIQWMLTPKAIRFSDIIISISYFIKEELIGVLGIEEDKIVVVYHGVDHELYKPMNKESCRRFFGLNTEHRYILYVASNRPHKRVDLAKAVFKEVRKCRDDVTLIKAGYSEKLEGEGIINVGWVKEEDMPKLYNTADVYLHTSEYEGFGLPVLEAMACGVPIVALNKASVPEVVGNAGYLVDSNDDCVKELAEGVLKILDRDTKVDKKALKRSMAFNWEKTARKTLEVYSMLV